MRQGRRLLKLALLAGMFASVSSALHAQTTPTLTWNANPETDIAGYRVYQGTQSGVYGPTPVDVGKVTSYQPQGVDWTHRAYFAVQAYNTSALVSPLSTEAVWVPAVSVTTITNLTSSSAYPLVANTAVTWTATATNNLGPVEYCFYLYKKTAWVMVQNYGPSNTYTWTPNASDVGTPYQLQVWVRAVGSTGSYDAFRGTFSFDVAPAPLMLTADVDFPTPPNNQIMWTATLNTTGGAAEYRFQVIDTATNTTTVLRDYSSSNQAQWVPLTTGNFVVQALERQVGSPNPYDLIANTPTLPVAATPLTITSFSTPTTFPAATGTPIKWTARVKGGMAGPVEYQFYLYTAATGWRNVQPYSPTETFTWTPATTEAGDYAVQVWVRSNGSTAAYEAYAATGVFHIYSSVQLTTTTLFPVAVGTTMTWTGDVPDPVNIEYEFWVYSAASAQWSLGRGWSTQKTFAWTPLVVGSYVLQVWARPVGSTVTYGTYRSTDTLAVVSQPAQMVSLTSNVALPATAGTTITWTAGATGGSAPLQYQFWRQDAGGPWKKVQDYSLVNTYTWITTAGDVGQHAIQARVRSGSSGTYESQLFTGVFNIK